MSESQQLKRIISHPINSESGRNGLGSLYPIAPTAHHPQRSPKPPSLIHSDGHNSDQPRNVQLTYDLNREALTRTPSPTPSEQQELDSQTRPTGWRALKERIGTRAFWMRKKMLIIGIAIIMTIAISTVFAVFHKQIMTGLDPVGQWLRSQPTGWLIPVGVLIVMSFPPLAGQEIIGLLCGIFFGLGKGFGIVALGTLLGEIVNYFTFKFCCVPRARKYEEKNIKHACLARVIRDGGLKVAVISRYTLTPPHFVTAIFSTVGINVVIFAAAAILTLPKHLLSVYLGTVFRASANGTSTKDSIISAAILIAAGIITIFCVKYVSKKTKEIKPQIIYERRKARQAKGLPSSSSEVLQVGTDSYV